jgi:hypothetical protein
MNQKHKAALACIAAFGCGVGVGHILTKTRLERIFEAELAEENENAKHYYSKMYKAEAYATPQQARETLESERVEEPMPPEAKEAFIRYSGKTVPSVAEPKKSSGERDVTTAEIYQEFHEKRKREAAAMQDPPPVEPIPKPIVRQNIWEPDHPALGKEPMRPDDKPYLMTFDEYNEDRHYSETEVVYYRGDKTVADENDEPIEEGQVDEIFGWDNLESFDDQFVIFIANPKLGKKFEVQRNDGEFSKLVAGFTDPDEVPKGDSG